MRQPGQHGRGEMRMRAILRDGSPKPIVWSVLSIGGELKAFPSRSMNSHAAHVTARTEAEALRLGAETLGVTA